MPTSTPQQKRAERARHYSEHYRKSFIRDFTMATEGWATELRDDLLAFFESEDMTPAYWLTLRKRDEQARAQLAAAVEAGQIPVEQLLAFRGEAETQLAQWAAARSMKRGGGEQESAA